MLSLVRLSVLLAVAAGCTCSNFVPVDDCNGGPCAGGSAGGETAGGTSGGSVAGGEAGGAAVAGGVVAGGEAGGTSVAGGAVAGGLTAGGLTAGGVAVAGGTAGGATAGGGGGTTAGGAAGGTAGGASNVDGGVFDVCAEFAARQCEFLSRCTTSNATGYRANNTVPSSQLASCEAQTRDACRIEQAALARGRVSFDLAGLRACLNAQFPTTTCARDLNAPRCVLANFADGLVATGSPCIRDLECARGYCSVNTGTGDTCGTCRTFSNPDGGAFGQCERDGQCTANTYCRRTSPVGQGQCSPRGETDAGCTSTTTCAPGFVCLVDAVRTCQLGKPEGAPCTKGRLECARTLDNFELVCATQVAPAGNVDLCQKRFNTAPLGACNTGESSGGTVAGPLCLESEYCESGRCAAKRPIGMACGTNNEACVAGARCVQGFCAAFSDVGQPCSNQAGNADCRTLLTCSQSMCRANEVGVGVMCTQNGVPQCYPGTYCPQSFMMQASCAAQKTTGVSCMGDRECLSGDCSLGMCQSLCWQ